MAPLERFVYSPLGPSEIRLIKILPARNSDTIHCTLENVSWDNDPQYETLSYVWGDDRLYASIILNGRPFLVRRNLWFALYHLRGDSETKPRRLREDEAIHATGGPSRRNISRRDKDFAPRMTPTQAQFSIRSAFSRGKARLGASSEDSEETSAIESDMDRLSIQERPSADSPTSGECRIVWIDAICINQDNILERNVQVQMMGMVYEKATRVSIWLGEEATNSRDGLRHFRDLNTIAEEPRTSSLKTRATSTYAIQESERPAAEVALAKEGWDAILNICYRPFWERLWVIQEVALSRDRLLMCGNAALPWQIFEGVLKTMVMDKGERSISMWKLPEEVRSRFMQSPAVKFFQGLKNIDFAGDTGRCSLRSLVTSFHGSMTTDPRDQIYGFLGIAAPTQEVTADYAKTLAELYIDVLKASVWSSNYIDHYLVHFSELLQRALGNPFWNDSKNSFVHIRRDMLVKKGANQVLNVRAILGNRMEWVTKSITSALPEKPKFQKMLARKNFNGGRVFQQITAFDKEKSSPVFQRFHINPYFGKPSEGGSALVSKIPESGDYLCFFKDCEVAAVVQLKDRASHTYVVVGRALVEQDTNFYDWTMECNVELTLNSLQLLTR